MQTILKGRVRSFFRVEILCAHSFGIQSGRRQERMCLLTGVLELVNLFFPRSVQALVCGRFRDFYLLVHI